MTINATKTVRELAVEIPGATRVFEKAGIDYCCGGGRSFEEACAAAGVSVEGVARSLEEAEQAATQSAEANDWRTADLSQLTSYIVSKHHVFTKEELERLDFLLTKVCSVHALRHPELLRIKDLFLELKEELLTHMQKEELVLFPYIEEMEGAANNRPLPKPFFGTVQNPVRVMSLEHDQAGEILKEIRNISSGFITPADACITYKTLYHALEAFEQDLHQHIHLENNILFPRSIEMESAFD